MAQNPNQVCPNNVRRQRTPLCPFPTASLGCTIPRTRQIHGNYNIQGRYIGTNDIRLGRSTIACTIPSRHPPPRTCVSNNSLHSSAGSSNPSRTSSFPSLNSCSWTWRGSPAKTQVGATALGRPARMGAPQIRRPLCPIETISNRQLRSSSQTTTSGVLPQRRPVEPLTHKMAQLHPEKRTTTCPSPKSSGKSPSNGSQLNDTSMLDMFPIPPPPRRSPAPSPRVVKPQLPFNVYRDSPATENNVNTSRSGARTPAAPSITQIPCTPQNTPSTAKSKSPNTPPASTSQLQFNIYHDSTDTSSTSRPKTPCTLLSESSNIFPIGPPQGQTRSQPPTSRPQMQFKIYHDSVEGTSPPSALAPPTVSRQTSFDIYHDSQDKNYGGSQTPECPLGESSQFNMFPIGTPLTNSSPPQAAKPQMQFGIYCDNAYSVDHTTDRNERRIFDSGSKLRSTDKGSSKSPVHNSNLINYSAFDPNLFSTQKSVRQLSPNLEQQPGAAWNNLPPNVTLRSPIPPDEDFRRPTECRQPQRVNVPHQFQYTITPATPPSQRNISQIPLEQNMSLLSPKNIRRCHGYDASSTVSNQQQISSTQGQNTSNQHQLQPTPRQTQTTPCSRQVISCPQRANQNQNIPSQNETLPPRTSSLLKCLGDKLSSTFGFLSSLMNSAQGATPGEAPQTSRPQESNPNQSLRSQLTTPSSCPRAEESFGLRNLFKEKGTTIEPPNMTASVAECAIAKKCGRVQFDKLDHCKTEDNSLKMRQKQIDQLVKDTYCPGTIQEAVDGEENFNNLAFNLANIDLNNMGDKPEEEPLTLLEAFVTRINLEREALKEKILEGSTKQQITDAVEKFFNEKHNPSDLNRSIKNHLHVELLMEHRQIEDSKTKSFTADVQKIAIEMPDNPNMKLIIYTASTKLTSGGDDAENKTINENIGESVVTTTEDLSPQAPETQEL